jgi:sporulation protein YlmC with PRC-barrel domain
MQLSRFLGLQVIDAAQHPVGTVIDVRLRMAGDPQDGPAAPQVSGFVVSPRTRASFLGYERSGADAPVMLAALLRWWHRGTFVATWDDVARVGSGLVRLRAGYTRHSAVLRDEG